MKFDFSVESMRDAVLARAALDGILGVLSSRGPEPELAIKSPVKETVIDKVARQVNEASVSATIGTVDSAVVETASAEPQSDPAGQGTASPEEGFTKEQIKAAADQNPLLATLVKGRGRKSAAQQAEINRLTAEVLGLPIPAAQTPAPAAESIGAALKGATASELAAALGQTTTAVHQEPGIEVRTIPEAAQTTTASPIAGDSSLAELLASRRAAQQPPAAVQEQPQPASPTVMPPTPPFADEAQYQAGKKPLDQMTNDELLQAIRDFSDQGAGLFWFRSVIERSKAGDQTKMTAEYMRQVLSNPDDFYPRTV